MCAQMSLALQRLLLSCYLLAKRQKQINEHKYVKSNIRHKDGEEKQLGCMYNNLRYPDAVGIEVDHVRVMRRNGRRGYGGFCHDVI